MKKLFAALIVLSASQMAIAAQDVTPWQGRMNQGMPANSQGMNHRTTCPQTSATPQDLAACLQREAQERHHFDESRVRMNQQGMQGQPSHPATPHSPR